MGRREYSDRVVRLVEFVKRRDPRVRARREALELERVEREKEAAERRARRGADAAKAREGFEDELDEEDLERIVEEERLRSERQVDLDDDYTYTVEKLPDLMRVEVKKGPMTAEELVRSCPFSTAVRHHPFLTHSRSVRRLFSSQYLYSVRNKRKIKIFGELPKPDRQKWEEMEGEGREAHKMAKEDKDGASSSDRPSAPPPPSDPSPLS